MYSTARWAQVERELDRNEQAQKQAQREQDGSEIRSVELERMLAAGQTLIERRNAYEIFRDHAADLFERHTGSSWRPRHAKAAPFRRNDAVLNIMPIGVLVFPGAGIQENLADKARKLGIPVWKFGSGGV